MKTFFKHVFFLMFITSMQVTILQSTGATLMTT